MMNNPDEISHSRASEIACDADIYFFAAGYEERACVIPKKMGRTPKLGIVVIKFEKGPNENCKGIAAAAGIFDRCAVEKKSVQEACYRVDHSAVFESEIQKACESFDPNKVSKICVDLSGMPQFVIMEVLAEVRRIFPSSVVTCIYIAACSYPPSDAEISRFLRAKEGGKISNFDFRLKFEPGEALFPKKFAGVGQRRGRSVMVLFAGYEKDRSHAAYDAINPTKLVLFHSLPQVKGAESRLAYSRAVHAELGGRIERSIELIDNVDVVSHVERLTEYYEWLYDLYDMVLVPAHSKLQTLASFLFWEMYPDVQIIFPVPVEYRSSSGGIGAGTAYAVELPPLHNHNFFQET